MATLARLDPRRPAAVAGVADGLDSTMPAVIRAALDAHPDTVAVYSIGGGNQAIAGELAARGMALRVFVGTTSMPTTLPCA